MRIAIIGAYGQLGTELRERLEGDLVPLGHEDLDITDARAVAHVLDNATPEFVINAAAYNQVDRAEDEPEQAYAINALGPRNLARHCAALDVPLLHVSTDYVFGLETSRESPYSESDAPGPLGAYAVSKLAGEYYVEAECPRHFVVRTCGVYGHAGARGKGNFVETMLRLAQQRDSLRIVDDQVCTPTASRHLAEAIARLITTDAYGLYHATNGGCTTWFGFAKEIFRAAGVEIDIEPISTEAFGAKARRPAYSVLDNGKLRCALQFELPRWQKALAEYLQTRAG